MLNGRRAIGGRSTELRIALLGGVLIAASILNAQDRNEIATGRSRFQQLCTSCHGDDAKGGRGPNLTTGDWRWGRSDDAIVKNIQQGIPGTEMPRFPVSESDGKAIVAYLRSLRIDGSGDAIRGDAAAGARLFFGTAKCSQCHIVKGRGGRLGPDLSTIGTERSAAEIRDAVANPDKSLRRGYETVEVRLRSGQLLRGARKNEDTFSIQIMDEQERLHMLLKQDIGEIRAPKKSLMPAPALAPADLDNLVAFLKNPETGVLKPAPWVPSPDLNVTFERLKKARLEPQNWLTYWGNYQGTHYSPLNSITSQNVASLVPQWIYQFGAGNNETVPIVVDGLMFVTGPMNNAAALDARTGRPIWQYRRNVPQIKAQCTIVSNRGFAILGDRLYMATLDAHLVALDAKTGSVVWDTEVADYRKGYSINHAPLAIDGKIVVGITSGECALQGFLDAYDAGTGKQLWRRWTVAQEGDPARSTWSGNSADYGGAPTWMTGTFDPETDTLYWPVGNPGPDYNGAVREGANLYSCTVLALDPGTGKMKWYFQFNRHDTHDWDATETPMLIDIPFRGSTRKLLVQANRNAFYYILDRESGKFLAGKAFVHQNWARGLDDDGHPIVIPGTDPTPEGVYVCPDATGATNWAAPSFDPKTNLFFVTVRDSCAIYSSKTREPQPGATYTGTGQQADRNIVIAGAIRALDPATGDTRWSFPIQEGSNAAGVLATGGGLVFAASREGNLIALNAVDGKPLWHYQTGGAIRDSPISYSVDGRQYIAISANSALITFALPQQPQR
jgi:PQQ-dependent dehydrogenase (methanol/ethanol family)